MGLVSGLRNDSTSGRHSSPQKGRSASTVRIAITRKLRGSRQSPLQCPMVFPTRLQRFDYFRSRRITGHLSILVRLEGSRVPVVHLSPFVERVIRRGKSRACALSRVSRGVRKRSGGCGGKLPAEIATRGSVARQLREIKGRLILFRALVVVIEDSRAESNRVRGEREIRFVSRILLEFACRSLVRSSTESCSREDAVEKRKRTREEEREDKTARGRESDSSGADCDTLSLRAYTHGYSDTSGLFFLWT